MLGICTLSAALAAQATGITPGPEPELINLKTPYVLEASHQWASVNFRYVGGYEKTFRGELEYGYGICNHLEIDAAASLGQWDTETDATGATVRSGGTDEEIALKYKLVDGAIPVSVQAGLAYVQTPAQDDRIAATLGASAGYEPWRGYKLYLNPRLVFLDNNTNIGLGVGLSARIVNGIDLIADWTPMLAGQNTIDMRTGMASQSELYGVGLRFRNLVQNGTIDVGVTNSTGSTAGTSLTPTLGGAPALFARLSYRF